MATTKKIRPELIKLATNIETMLELWGLSQEVFGDIMGESRSTVSNWTRAHSSPDVNNLLMLHQMTGVSIEDLINKVIPAEKIPQNPLAIEGQNIRDSSGQVLGLFNDLGLRYQIQLILDRLDALEDRFAIDRQTNGDN